jgi:hypothetical protein
VDALRATRNQPLGKLARDPTVFVYRQQPMLSLLVTARMIQTIPLKAPTGIEPVDDLLRSLEPKIRLYVEHFRALGDGDRAP